VAAIIHQRFLPVSSTNNPNIGDATAEMVYGSPKIVPALALSSGHLESIIFVPIVM